MFVLLCIDIDPWEYRQKEIATTDISEPDPATVNVAQSADLHGALTGIVSPAQLQAVTTARKNSEMTAAATFEIGDWSERQTAASAQLVGFTRINSQRRAEMVDQVYLDSPCDLPCAASPLFSKA